MAAAAPQWAQSGCLTACNVGVCGPVIAAAVDHEPRATQQIQIHVSLMALGGTVDICSAFRTADHHLLPDPIKISTPTIVPLAKPNTMDVRERLRPFGITFEKSLEDLIKGIRSAQHDQDKLTQFLNNSIQECRTELKSSDLDSKSTAILKLAYLEMYGFDMSWCAFNILEVMSSPKFQHKRIGYLAAIQILQRQNNDDALMLMTNLLKKDLNSVHYIETSLAISGIATVVTSELALDICDDISKMLTHSKPLIRKKAILAMYKIFLKNPEALRSYYTRIVDRLDDDDTSVVSATVNVICELAYMNPANYIELAPRLYDMMQTSRNNWMVIRILKLFSSFSLVEPRLKKKLLPEITMLMTSTKALSITYECINSILTGNMLSEDDIETAQLIVQKLISFFETKDRNLKYVGLLALIKTCKIHRNLIQEHSQYILTSIYDTDATIREKALEVVNSLVNEKNIVAIVLRLTIQLLPYREQHVQLEKINRKLMLMFQREQNNNTRNPEGEDEDGDDDEDVEEYEYLNTMKHEFSLGPPQQPIIVSEKYKYTLINKIIEVCSMNNYAYIPSFKWYLGVLNDILNLNSFNKISNIDQIVSEQLVDIALRVPSTRPKLVEMCLELCGVPSTTEEYLISFKNGLSNCMWIVGEYYDSYLRGDNDEDEDEESSESDSESDTDNKLSLTEIIESISNQTLLERLGYTNFDNTILIYIQAVAKMFSKFCSLYGDGRWSQSQFKFVKTLLGKIIAWLTKFENSPNFEIQERALSFIEVLRLVDDALNVQLENLETFDESAEFPPSFLTRGYGQLFSLVAMKPVGAKAQQKVKPPVDFDMSEAFDEQAFVNFQTLYTRLKMEELNVESSDAESQSEDNDVLENLLDSIEEPEGENTSHKAKDLHKDDPFYIKTNDEDMESHVSELSSAAEISKKSKTKSRKPSKPRKHKKEKVLILEDEEEERDTNKAENRTDVTSARMESPLPFFSDTSRLAAVDLTKHEEKMATPMQEYQVENSEYLDPMATKKDEIKLDLPTVEIKKKPKKKAKRKVAIIE